MVRNLAFILCVLSHVGAFFFFITVNFLKKKKDRQRDVHCCAACSRQVKQNHTRLTRGEFFLKLVLL